MNRSRCSFAWTFLLVGSLVVGTAACGSSGGRSHSPKTDAASDAPAGQDSAADASPDHAAADGSAGAGGTDGGSSDGSADAGGPTSTFVNAYVDQRYGSEGRIAVQADGKIVFAGSDVRRYSSDFQPDASFGNSGIVSISGATWYDVALQADGKIVVAGSSSKVAVVARLSGTDGSLDTTFAAGGIATVPFPYNNSTNTSSFNSLAIQPDGAIVAGGNYNHWLSQVGSGFYDAYAIIARFTSTGALDGSFNASGTAGVLELAKGSNESETSLSSGKILMLGSITSGTALVRIDSDGTLDTSFGTSGILNPIAGGTVSGSRMAIQSDGKIVLVSGGNGVWRLNPDGSVDPSFGKNGLSSTTSSFSGADIRVDSGGKAVAVGVSGSAQPFKMGILRLNPDGSRDASLQTGTELGIATLDTPAPNSSDDAQGSSLGFGSDGSIVAAGVVTLMPSFNQMPLLARLK